MIRIGTVMAADAARRMARVKFPDMGTDSGWMPVMQCFGSSYSIRCPHPYTFSITCPGGNRMPKIGSRVACADVEDGDDNEIVILGEVM